MNDKTLLSLFTIDWETATRNEDFLPEYISGKIRYEWDSVEKKYTDTPKCVIITAFFYSLKKSKIDVILPANVISQKILDDLNTKVEKDEDVTLIFENFKLGLKAGFNGEVQLECSADNVKIQ